MTKSDLIRQLAEANPHLYQRDIERIVSTVFEDVTEALVRGDRVELRGFGAFTVKHRAPRIGRNPRTGASVAVAEKFVPFFKTGKDLRDRLIRLAGARDLHRTVAAMDDAAYRLSRFFLAQTGMNACFGTFIAAARTGFTSRGVTMITNSVSWFSKLVERNRLPIIGIDPRTGNWLMVSLKSRRMRPAMAKLSPSRSSTVVRARRV